MMPYILWLCGLLCIFIEFFLPGAIFGTLGGLLLLASLLLFAAQANSILAVAAYTFLLLGSTVGAVVWALRVIRHSGQAQTFRSDDTQDGFVASTYDSTAVGKRGVVLSDLKPGGYILVDDKKLAAISASGYIIAGTSVQVLSGQEDVLIVTAIGDGER